MSIARSCHLLRRYFTVLTIAVSITSLFHLSRIENFRLAMPATGGLSEQAVNEAQAHDFVC
jgi:hypothetical protein